MNEEPVFIIDDNEDTANAILFLLDNHHGCDATDRGINRALVTLLASYTCGSRSADRFLVADREWLLDKLSEIFGEEAKTKLQGGSAFLVYCTQSKGKH